MSGSADTHTLVSDLAEGQLADQRDSREALDTKAGLVLTAAVIIAGLLRDDATSWFTAVAVILNAAAALVALAAFWPRRFDVVDAAGFEKLLAAVDVIDVATVLTSKRITAIQANEGRLRRKAWILRAAAVLLVVAVFVETAGTLGG